MRSIGSASLHRGPESRCPECGARVSGGLSGCEALYHEVVARELNDSAYFVVHRFTEYAYALQHPEEYLYTPKLFAVQLTGLLWVLDFRADREIGRQLREWLDTNPTLEALTPPTNRGGLTIVEVYQAPNSANHMKRVKKWAGEVWEAYGAYHDIARQWLNEAIKHS